MEIAIWVPVAVVVICLISVYTIISKLNMLGYELVQIRKQIAFETEKLQEIYSHVDDIQSMVCDIEKQFKPRERSHWMDN